MATPSDNSASPSATSSSALGCNLPPTGVLAASVAASTSKSAKLKAAVDPIARPEEPYVPFTELIPHSEEPIKALICRAWDAKNPYGRYLGTEYIISDDKGNAMHCIARNSIAHCVVSKLQIGNIYSIRRFRFEDNKEAYRVRRDDQFIIQLEGTTLIRKVECSDTGFVKHPFQFMQIEEIAPNGNKYFIDVIVRVINMGEWKPTRNGSHFLDFHLINERGRSIKVTLWGLLGQELITRSGGPDVLYVVALPAMKIREHRGGVQIQSTGGTSIYDDRTIPQIAELRQIMGNGAVPPPDNTGTLRQLLLLGREQYGLNRIHSVTLHCSIKIVGIHRRSTWNYNSCGERGCKKGLTPAENKLYCESCEKM